MSQVAIRSKVIEQGVKMENAISKILGFILDIDKVEDSQSFGSKSSALSFNAKINLLTDLKFVSADIKKWFQLFAEIRNKFAHVLQVDTFVECFKMLEDKDDKKKDKKKNKFIKDFYLFEQEIDEENKLDQCFGKLCLTLRDWMTIILEKARSEKDHESKNSLVIETLRSFFNRGAMENDIDKMKKILYGIKGVVEEITQDSDQEFVKVIDEGVKNIYLTGK